MGLSAVQLWQRIEATGLATSHQIRAFAADMSEELPADQMLDGGQAANWLVAKKHFTKYQVRVLLKDLEGPLRCGDYRVQAQLSDPVLNNWYRAKVDGDGQEYWLLAIPCNFFDSPEFQANPPSIFWSQAQSQLLDSSLCALTPAQISDGYLCVASSVPNGRALGSTMSGIAMPAQAAKGIVIQVAMALDRIHAAKLVHGDIGMHSVWWDGDQLVTLLRDPVFLPVNPLIDQHRLSTINASAVDRLRYAAPEFTAPGTQPSVASDLYALGCLWYELLTGKPLVQDDNLSTLVKSILQVERQKLQVAGWDAQHDKVLDYLLAKNPSVRFASVGHFLQAVQAASSKSVAPASTPKPNTPKDPPASKSMGRADTQNPNNNVTQNRKQEPTIAEAWKKDPATAIPNASIDSSKKKSTRENQPRPQQPNPTKTNPAVQASPQPSQTPKVKPPETPVAMPPTSQTLPTEPRAAATPPVKPPERTRPRPAQPEAEPEQPIQQSPVVTPQSVPVQKNEEAPAKPMANSESPAIKTPAAQSRPKLDLGTSAPRPLAARNVRRAKQRPKWFLPAMAVGAIVLMGGLAFGLMSRSSEKTITKPLPPKSDNQDAANKVQVPEVETRPDPLAEQFVLVSDVAQSTELLWAPPHVADPVPLQMLPPGMQGVLHLNVASIQQQTEFDALAELLGPAYQQLKEAIQTQLPIGWEQLDQLTIALYPSDTSEWPDLVMKATAKSNFAIAASMQKYKFSTPPEPVQIGKSKAIRNSNSTLSVVMLVADQESQEATVCVVGSPQRITEMIEMDGGIAPLVRQLEQLRQSTSVQNDATFLSTTSLLLSSGRGILANSLASLLPYLRSTMREDIAAVSLTTNLDEAWYVELRMLGKDEQSSPRIGQELKKVLDNLPGSAEAALVSQQADPYWAKIAIRFPQQLRALKEHLRSGIEDGQNIVNFYLPSQAAANLTLASWMSLRANPGAPTMAAAASRSSQANANLSIDEILMLPMTIAFDQESFEVSARTVAEDFNSGLSNPLSAVNIVIDGNALEKDGITRNYQIRNFKHKDVPLRTVLIDLVRKGNPITTVQNANEIDQKLVWVVKDEPSHLIEITTRAAVEAQGLKLPNEFVAD